MTEDLKEKTPNAARQEGVFGSYSDAECSNEHPSEVQFKCCMASSFRRFGNVIALNCEGCKTLPLARQVEIEREELTKAQRQELMMLVGKALHKVTVPINRRDSGLSERAFIKVDPMTMDLCIRMRSTRGPVLETIPAREWVEALGGFQDVGK